MFLTFFSHFLSFQTNISSNPTKPKFIKTHILNTQQKKFIKSEINPKSETNKTRMGLTGRSARASRSAIRRDDLGFDKWCDDFWVRDDRWQMGLTIYGFTTIYDEWVWRFLGSRSEEWVRRCSLSLSLSVCTSESFLLSLSLSLGIAQRMSSVLGFLGSSELLDVDRSCLRRCWGAGAISLPCCLYLSLLFSWGRSDLKWKWERKLFSALSTLFYCQTKNIFSLIEFSVTAKHPLFQKSISGISLKPKQTEPKSQVICKLRILVRSQ